MSYFVVDPNSGQKYGPVDIEGLNRWIAEGRVTPQSVLEDAVSGAQIGAAAVAGLIFGAPTPPTPPSYAPPSAPVAPTGEQATSQQPSPYPRSGLGTSDQTSKITASYICSVLGVFCCPLVLCSVGIMLGSQAKKEGDPRGQTAMTVGTVCLIAGIVIGILSFAAQGGMNRFR